ncbi:restriction endonuclease [Polaromonas sp.]|jgi:GTPase SAR1 family protein|uniref:nSTAND3 domain-containing NTPase n=1 Tax=Polaromonas sp. TaxID=1869339 RepID=UPI000BDA4604|nr:restriction endonuclease [Polaromonas sp.]OZB48310.1 MAG: hypothetical protein B7X60_04225 [Polynucleobacter sp. 39-45-136]HQS60073.1 restriction endonuclease [Gallionellaceae bacterium]HQS89953.1 restriction endonuclease [Polaromonas sp.]
MPAYDFLSLDDKEFEKLVTSLLSASEGVRYERFKSGKDAGIDGRYFSFSGTVILQCKHWARSGVAALIRALKNSELKKVIKLKPARYILATSLELSASDKQKIFAIFKPYMRSESDVIGNEDLNDLLEIYPNIEIANNKLWMYSATVLSQISNSAIRGRSQFSLAEMHRNRARYVETNTHFRAANKLAEHKVVLITGEPGVGKTTLAEQLCLDHVIRGFQLCVAAKDIEELESIYNNDIKQIFYFDDFLGRTFLEAMNPHQDSHITGFIKRIRSDNSKRFILTSRTTILNRGKALAEIFKIEKIDRHELELTITDLQAIDKARILHSSIWFSGLSPEYVEVIASDKKYRRVIAHRNFNPRLISFVTDPARISQVPVENYWNYLTAMLDNPADVWGHVYDQQITEFQRLLVLLVVFGGREISDNDLREAYRIIVSDAIVTASNGDRDYDRNVRVLVGSLLNRSLDDNDCVTYRLFNPSIADFAVMRVSAEKYLLVSIFAALSEVSSIFYLDRLIIADKIKPTTARYVLTCLTVRLLSMKIDQSNTPLFLIVTRLAVKHNPKYEGTQTVAMKLLTYLRLDKDASEQLPRVTSILIYCVSHSLIDFDFILRFTDGLSADDLDLADAAAINELSSAIEDQGNRGRLEDIFQPISLKILRNYITEEVHEREILNDFYDINNIDGPMQAICDAVEMICREIGISIADGEVLDIAEEVDVIDVINDNIDRSMNSRDDYRPTSQQLTRTVVIDEIDDLFLMDTPPVEGDLILP